ncbi:MAG: alpha-amylase family glycosyl hydrolase [Kineosporiaceae bacterium]
MNAPTATYRVQLHPGFGFAEVAELAGYLARLGISHVYLSPVLQATPGSMHGYDVVDHARLRDDFGGRPAFDAMAAQLTRHGLSVVVDVVPNHMAVPTPVRLNTALWSVLRDGPTSPYARWFDVDWSGGNHAVLMPVLAERITAGPGRRRTGPALRRPRIPGTCRNRAVAAAGPAGPPVVPAGLVAGGR